ncbi:rod shape-determining protein MreD [Vagococcus penaei]|uniref:Rod shape-determining protein MreD n=1 Tax=Vagococcus penaei TaxID=633807 RepID=A0A1Q2D6F6_9ENTE|nr:rod shape-determining protein MreD [Vagococcus penaei]AQP54019.1 rod shape-determining protein MreD [Vagococcus penaei]RSU01746.1 rod shape-determining protein MreD [Vagococcus penaei]
MTKERKKRLFYALPFIFFFLMLFDGHLSSIILTIFAVPMSFTSNLLLMMMMFATFQMSKSYMISWALVMGLLYDSYYYNVIGINFVLFPLLVWFMYLLFERVVPNTFTIILAFILFVTALSVGRVILLSLFKLTDTTILDYLTRTLAPTLVVNLILIIILVGPLKKLVNIKR